MTDMLSGYNRVRPDGKLKPLPNGLVVTGRGSGYAHHYWLVDSDHPISREEASDIAYILDGGYLFGSRIEQATSNTNGTYHYKIVGYID